MEVLFDKKQSNSFISDSFMPNSVKSENDEYYFQFFDADERWGILMVPVPKHHCSTQIKRHLREDMVKNQGIPTSFDFIFNSEKIIF